MKKETIITRKEIRTELDNRYKKSAKKDEPYYLEISINKKFKDIRLKTLLGAFWLLGGDKITITRKRLIEYQEEIEEKEIAKEN